MRDVALSIKYRPEIDGLRALAVFSVIVFHLNSEWLPGGFVGVDIFFVISGYLITSIILNDLHKGEFSLWNFWQRRIARIAPAFFTVVTATLIVAYFVYSAQDYASLGANSVAAAASVINIKLLMQGNYFHISPDSQPLLHYWSLSVEEQFYLIFPLYIYTLHVFCKNPFVVTIVLALCSFVLCVVTTSIRPEAAFYLLPTRAWELLAGATLALRHDKGEDAIPKNIGWLAVLVLFASAFFMPNDDRFPGWLAAIPVVATLGLIAAHKNAPFPLKSAPLVSVGLLSFSLYLWHWPVFSLVDYYFYTLSFPIRSLAKLGICISLSLLSYFFVERTARKHFNQRSFRRFAFVGCAALIALTVASGSLVRSMFYLNVSPYKVADGGIVIQGGDKGRIVVVGDSQGAMYGLSFVDIAKRNGLTVNLLASAAGNQLPAEPRTLWPDVKHFIGEVRPDVVVIAQAWSSKLGDARQLSVALDTIEEYGAEVVILGQPPLLSDEAGRHFYRSGGSGPIFENESAAIERIESNELLQSKFGDRAQIVEVAPLLRQPNGSIRLIAKNGKLTFQDFTHLSNEGAKLIEPFIEQAVLFALKAE